MTDPAKIHNSFKAKPRLKAVLALGALAIMLSGCVVYPSNGYYPGYAYAPAPVYYGPPVAVDFGFGGGWGHHWH
jgi:hypothetical protein